VSEPELEPHIEEILETVMDEHGLDVDVAYELIDRAHTLEGDELNQALEAVLRRA
jgi:hypothetical protein